MKSSSEDLRLIQNEMDEFDLAEFYSNFDDIYGSVEMKVIDLGETSITAKSYTTERMTISIAINSLISKILLLENFNYERYQSEPEEYLLELERNFFYVLDNTKEVLCPIFQDIAEEIIIQASDSVSYRVWVV